ncbi:MAG: aromatic ring-hydroxylating oxygenase subunit alpha [Ilumatobacter sp.]|uniref:aromatic ring-hydroxylating oxygenase subunit alpha n=1 Tax=Ilumatobacter sp. TaxID=1967498 RepID=UPI00391D0A24
MTSDSARTQLIAQARRTIEHVEQGTIPLVDDTMTIPVSRYQDQERWAREVDIVFKRTPLMLGFSIEIPNPGDYKAMDVVGVKVIITRGVDGQVRSFVNMCSHRGAQLVDEGTGSTRRFACPYHNWNYDNEGTLVGVTNRQDFGEVDTSCLGLTPLPTAERCGLLWVVLTPGAEMDIDAHLGGYAEMLDHFDFGDRWYSLGNQQIPGPNWKLAYDGYLDFYHIPFLHRDTFGPDFSSRPIYDAWGPHQRMTAFSESLLKFKDVPDDEIDLELIDGGVWTIFPHVSIAGFPVGNRGLMVSQLFPGPTPDTSITIQNFLTDTEPDDELRELAKKTAAFYDHVVRDEDYFTGIRIGQNIETGAKSQFLFGRNEGGGQTFHRYLDQLLA